MNKYAGTPRTMPKVRRYSAVRGHTNADGTSKKPLTEEQAAAARAKGLQTYICPVCRKLHRGHGK